MLPDCGRRCCTVISADLISPSVHICRLQRVHISDPSSFPLDTLVAASSLDPAQARAMNAMLTQELAVVQGPPGTGELCIGGLMDFCEIAGDKVGVFGLYFCLRQSTGSLQLWILICDPAQTCRCYAVW